MEKYTLEVFDSRNTARLENLPRMGRLEAVAIARERSRVNPFPVIVSNGEMWQKYEAGEKTEWSFNQ